MLAYTTSKKYQPIKSFIHLKTSLYILHSNIRQHFSFNFENKANTSCSISTILVPSVDSDDFQMALT
jgi:hypothetical protein